MGYKKVSEFEEIFNIKDSDMFLIDRGGQPKAIKAINMMKYFGSGGGGGAEPSGTLSITISGNNTVDNNAWFTGSSIAYDTNSGAYGWLYGRDLKEIKISYNGHDYVYWDTTETKPAYFFQFIDDDNAVIIMGGGADSSKFDFYIVAGSDNATVENLPSALKHDDVVGAVYDYETLTTTESDFPMTLEFTNMAVVEPEPTATFNFTLTDDDFGTIEGVGLSAYRKTFSGLSDFLNGKDFDELKLQLNDGEELPKGNTGNNAFMIDSGSTDTLKILTIGTDDMSSQGFNLLLYISLAENASTSFGSMAKDEVILVRYNTSGAPSALPDSYMPFTVKFNYYGYVEPSPEPEPEPSGNSFTATFNESDLTDVPEISQSEYQSLRKVVTGLSDFLTASDLETLGIKFNNIELSNYFNSEDVSNVNWYMLQDYRQLVSIPIIILSINMGVENPSYGLGVYISLEDDVAFPETSVVLQKDECIICDSNNGEISSSLYPITIEFIRE